MHQPETLSPGLVDRLVKLAREKGREHVGAMILEGVDRATGSPGGYLHSLLEKGVDPAPASVDKAKALLGGTKSLLDLEIGVEVLPGDWIQEARKFGIRCSVNDAASRRSGLLERLERFGGRVTPRGPDAGSR